MALAWTLRDPRVTSAVIGAGSVVQLEENLAALGAVVLSAGTQFSETFCRVGSAHFVVTTVASVRGRDVSKGRRPTR